jgi:hypothetical protein
MVRRFGMQQGGLVAACAVTVFLGGGCGGETSATSSSEEAAVHGTVKLQGKLVRSGTVSFEPSRGDRSSAMPRTAPIRKDGTYSLKTLVGTNRVNVSAPAFPNEPNAQRLIPECDVRSENNTFNIEFPPPGR